MGNEITIGEALSITLISMSIVFLTLFAISLVLSSFKTIFKEKPQNQSKKGGDKELALTHEEDEEEKVVVALAASIMAGKGILNPNLRIKSITRIK